MAEQAVTTVAAPPEEVLTEIVALASSVDGVDIVVGAYEGFTYTVQAQNPELELYADEIAASSVAIIESARGRVPGEEANPRIIISEYGDKALLIGDLGEKFTVAVVGGKRVLEETAAPIERLIRRQPFKCPSCGANLDVHSMTCERCGKRIPLTAKACPYCGHRPEIRRCPSCGAELVVTPEKVESASAALAVPRTPAPAPAAAAEAPAAGTTTSGAVDTTMLAIGGAATVVYYIAMYGAGVGPLKATLAGAPILAALWLVLFTKRK